MNGIPAETANTEAGAPAEQPPPAQKSRSAAQKAHVAPSKAKSGNKATPAKKANRGAKSAQSPKKATGARQGSKTAKVLDLLKRSGGASLKELMKATAWRPPRANSILRSRASASTHWAVFAAKSLTTVSHQYSWFWSNDGVLGNCPVGRLAIGIATDICR